MFLLFFQNILSRIYGCRVTASTAEKYRIDTQVSVAGLVVDAIRVCKTAVGGLEIASVPVCRWRIGSDLAQIPTEQADVAPGVQPDCRTCSVTFIQ